MNWVGPKSIDKCLRRDRREDRATEEKAKGRQRRDRGMQLRKEPGELGEAGVCPRAFRGHTACRHLDLGLLSPEP